MSAITEYLKMNTDQLGEEIIKQKKKITSAQETISLLKKLQIATSTISRTRQSQTQPNANMQNSGMENREVTGTP